MGLHSKNLVLFLHLEIEKMETKEDFVSHWISPELRTEFTDQYSTSEIDGNGCDIKIISINDQVYYR